MPPKYLDTYELINKHTDRSTHPTLPVVRKQRPDLLDRKIDLHVVIDLADLGGSILWMSLHAGFCVRQTDLVLADPE